MRIAVIGTGIMGQGIALAAARAGLEVVLIGRTVERALVGCKGVEKAVQRLVAKGELSKEAGDGALDLIVASDLASVGVAEFVIETIGEDLDAKRSLFAELGRRTGEEVPLASNTSSLSIAALGAASGCPSRVVGMHFFNPVAVLELVELSTTRATSDTVRTAALELAAMLGKTPVVVADRAGFVVNRVLFAMLAEACRTVDARVATPADVDTAMRLGCAHKLGPFALMDLIGLDTCLAIFESLTNAHGRSFEPTPTLRAHVAAGRLGRKTKAGFLSY